MVINIIQYIVINNTSSWECARGSYSKSEKGQGGRGAGNDEEGAGSLMVMGEPMALRERWRVCFRDGVCVDVDCSDMIAEYRQRVRETLIETWAW